MPDESHHASTHSHDHAAAWASAWPLACSPAPAVLLLCMCCAAAPEVLDMVLPLFRLLVLSMHFFPAGSRVLGGRGRAREQLKGLQPRCSQAAQHSGSRAPWRMPAQGAGMSSTQAPHTGLLAAAAACSLAPPASSPRASATRHSLPAPPMCCVLHHQCGGLQQRCAVRGSSCARGVLQRHVRLCACGDLCCRVRGRGMQVRPLCQCGLQLPACTHTVCNSWP